VAPAVVVPAAAGLVVAALAAADPAAVALAVAAVDLDPAD
jgi:hypothetical protein